jgi:hypothetical protein
MILNRLSDVAAVYAAVCIKVGDDIVCERIYQDNSFCGYDANGHGNVERGALFLEVCGSEIVIFLRGKLNPMFFNAALMRPLLSLTAASGRPTVEKCGRLRAAISTSTSIR